MTLYVIHYYISNNKETKPEQNRLLKSTFLKEVINFSIPALVLVVMY